MWGEALNDPSPNLSPKDVLNYPVLDGERSLSLGCYGAWTELKCIEPGSGDPGALMKVELCGGSQSTWPEMRFEV